MSRETEELYQATQTIKTSAGDICYVKKGSGPVVFFVHGIPLSLVTWRRNLDDLARDHTVIAPDLIGFGRSGKAAEDYSTQAHAAYMIELLERLGVESCSVVGSSYGCSIVLEMAIAKPSLVERMMLINSVGVPKGRHSLERFARIGLAKAAISNLLSSNSYGKKLIARHLRKAYADDTHDVGELAALYHGMLSEGGVQTYLKTLAAFDEERIFGLFGEAKHRTLLIWGRHDKVLPPKNARILEEKLEDAKIVYMEESGHLPHEEEPEVINRLIRQFVNTSSQISSRA